MNQRIKKKKSHKARRFEKYLYALCSAESRYHDLKNSVDVGVHITPFPNNNYRRLKHCKSLEYKTVYPPHPHHNSIIDDGGI